MPVFYVQSVARVTVENQSKNTIHGPVPRHRTHALNGNHSTANLHIEKSSTIGGQAAHLGCKAVDACQRCHVCLANETLRQFREAEEIHCFLNAEIQNVQPLGQGRYRVDWLTNANFYLNGDLGPSSRGKSCAANHGSHGNPADGRPDGFL